MSLVREFGCKAGTKTSVGLYSLVLSANTLEICAPFPTALRKPGAAIIFLRGGVRMMSISSNLFVPTDPASDAAMRAFRCSVLLVFILIGMGTACAEEAREPAPDTAHWYIQGGAYVHYDNRDDYQGPPIVGSIEYHKGNRWFGGFSAFNNSFGQFTQYLYLGKEFRPWDSHPHTRVKVSAGIVQGYRDEHYDTLPIRWGGSWGLGAVPSIGYQKGRVGYDAAILGVGGLLFLVGYSF